MKHFIVATIFAGLVSICASVYAEPAAKSKAKAPEPLPSMSQIKDAFEAGDFAGTLKMLTRVLPTKGAPTAGYDRYELLMMRGESQLRLKQVKSATDTFELAAGATREPRDIAKARATELTLRAAKDYRVQRRFAVKDGPNSADVVDPKQREVAMRIVYDDLKQTIEPKVKEARRARELPPIADAFKQLQELQDFELALTGLEDSQKSARDELGVRARDLIAKELDRFQKDLQKINDSANEVVAERMVNNSTGRARYAETGELSPNAQFVTSRRGISKAAKVELQEMIGTCRKIIPTLDSLSHATTSVTVDDVDDLVRRAKDVSSGAERALNTRY